MIIVHKYSCGCVGIPLPDTTKTVMLYACDRDSYDDPISFFVRDMADKAHTPLTVEQQSEYLRSIGSLIADGYAMRSLSVSIGVVLTRKE